MIAGIAHLVQHLEHLSSSLDLFFLLHQLQCRQVAFLLIHWHGPLTILGMDLPWRQPIEDMFLQTALLQHVDPCSQAYAEVPNVCPSLLEWTLEFARELPGTAEVAGCGKIHQAPEIHQRILDRGSRAGDPEISLQRLQRIGHQGSGCLDPLCLIQHDDRPGYEPHIELEVTHGLIGRKDQIRLLQALHVERPTANPGVACSCVCRLRVLGPGSRIACCVLRIWGLGAVDS